MYKKLFIPGPVNVEDDVLKQMSRPMIGHRSKEASELQEEITKKLKKLFYTQNDILLSTSSGSGLMEGAIRTCTQKRAAVFTIGAFGERWYDIASANSVPADKFPEKWGSPLKPAIIDNKLSTGKYDLVALTHNETSTGVMNNLLELAEIINKYPDVVWCVDAVSSAGGTKINVDKLGIDICITSTQKALGLPPGLSVCTFSDKARRAGEKAENRGFYFDLIRLYKYMKEKPFQYPSTPAVSQMYTLNYRLDKIIKKGLEKRFKAHKKMAEYTQSWAGKHFDLFAPSDYASPTVTTVINTKRVDIKTLINKLAEKNYLISNGYGKLKNQTFRIAHMAETTVDDLKQLFNIIEEILNL